ncbi:hypothetical protein CKO15_04560 [Halorhodospira abdelmalekii]|nr:hypothetical protein [Halorhodospira abdelmalekii]
MPVVPALLRSALRFAPDIAQMCGGVVARRPGCALQGMTGVHPGRRAQGDDQEQDNDGVRSSHTLSLAARLDLDQSPPSVKVWGGAGGADKKLAKALPAV